MLKENWKPAAGTYARTVASTFLSFFVYFSVGVIASAFGEKNTILPTGILITANVIAQLLQLGLFMALLYSNMWLLGTKDANAVGYKHRKPDPYRGFKIGLLAAIPSITAFVLLVLDKVFVFWEALVTWYRVANFTFYPFMVWAFGTEFTGTVLASVSWSSLVIAGIPVLFLPLVTGGFYLLGYHRISLKERLLYGNKKKK